jgi:CRP-like cAMP-binding protein
MQVQHRLQAALKGYLFPSGIAWDRLTPATRAAFRQSGRKLSLKKKEVLFRQGSYPQGCYFLLSGKVKVYQLNYDGTIQILFIYGPGDAFGYRPILSNGYQPVSVAALEACQLLFIPRQDFQRILSRSVSLSNRLLISLSHEFTVLTNRMNILARRTIKERLALALLILQEKFRDPAAKDLAAPITLTRTDLAAFVGTSLENLIRTLHFFREKKLISLKGRAIVISRPENLLILSSIG